MDAHAGTSLQETALRGMKLALEKKAFELKLNLGFGLPAAIGTAGAKPDAIIIDIDGDGSFMMNLQELVTIQVQNLSIEIFVLNRKHLRMVNKCQVGFRKSWRGHSCLGAPLKNLGDFSKNVLFGRTVVECGKPAAQTCWTQQKPVEYQLLV
ncbi:unnamed protein product [Dovyalis caffra]|uniref:Thiamine pyrophosphate enzyme TPP-binding domain-containing protein n=1 Tax=Dovyalis caffra TaxID=77055 RepID=A0AAV1SN47_9ROSI|nr:unnamed protein product [Dovyalis caffra]